MLANPSVKDLYIMAYYWIVLGFCKVYTASASLANTVGLNVDLGISILMLKLFSNFVIA